MILETLFRNKMNWTAVTPSLTEVDLDYLSGLILRKPILGWLTVTLEFSKGVIASLRRATSVSKS